MRVQVHVFQLHDDGPAAEELDEDCDVSSANHWMLPSGDEHNSPSRTQPEILLNRVNCVAGLYPIEHDTAPVLMTTYLRDRCLV